MDDSKKKKEKKEKPEKTEKKDKPPKEKKELVPATFYEGPCDIEFMWQHYARYTKDQLMNLIATDPKIKATSSNKKEELIKKILKVKLEEKTGDDLRGICERISVSKAGSKIELIDRILSSFKPPPTTATSSSNSNSKSNVPSFDENSMSNSNSPPISTPSRKRVAESEESSGPTKKQKALEGVESITRELKLLKATSFDEMKKLEQKFRNDIALISKSQLKQIDGDHGKELGERSNEFKTNPHAVDQINMKFQLLKFKVEEEEKLLLEELENWKKKQEQNIRDAEIRSSEQELQFYLNKKQELSTQMDQVDSKVQEIREKLSLLRRQ